MLAHHFQAISALLRAEAGLSLAPDRVDFLEARLLEVARKWHCPDLDELVYALRARADPAQIRDMVEATTINESLFFRDAKPFELLRDTLLPSLQRVRPAGARIRIWSAACAAGQEPYSIAMLLSECLTADLDTGAIDIVATDISGEMIDRAAAGIYSAFEVQRGLPEPLLTKYFVRAGNGWRISDRIRRRVGFERHNLLHDPAPLGMFDIVFCRNVLIYFDLPTKAGVLAAIRRQMSPDGYLVLGAAETVIGVSSEFAARAGFPGIYIPNAAAAPQSRR